MVNRIKACLLLGGVIASTFVSMLSVSPVFADDAAGNDAVRKAAAAWIVMRFIRTHSQGDSTISRDDAGNWFFIHDSSGSACIDHSNGSIGWVGAPQAGRFQNDIGASCSQGHAGNDDILAVLSSVGLDGMFGFLNYMGYKQDPADPGSDFTGPSKGLYATQKYDDLVKKVWPKGTPYVSVTASNPPDWIKYIDTATALQAKTIRGNGDPGGPPGTNDDADDPTCTKADAFKAPDNNGSVSLVNSSSKVQKYNVIASDHRETWTMDGLQQCSSLINILSNNALAQAYLNVIKANGGSTSPPKQKTGNDSTSDEKSNCNINGIGWIVCPVMTFMGNVVDAAYAALVQLLTVPAVDTSGNSTLMKAWSMMRNLANIAFIIAFLMIIYSQITSVGISNYGIKKMLPRIIIAAILVNVSYWICALAVDLSNVAGQATRAFFDSITNGIAPKNPSKWWGGANTGVSGSQGGSVVWTAGIAYVLAMGTSAIFGSLTILLPLLITALVAVITAVAILTVRQALIIILIVVAPLAFVAYLLPNTEKWFKRWRETFTMLLIMFPAVALVFGASKMASVIIMNSAGGNMLLQILGAGISIIPLMLTPMLMKVSSGVLTKVGGFVNNPNRGPIDRMRKGAANIQANQVSKNRANRLNGWASRDKKGKFARARATTFGAPAALGMGMRARSERAKAQEATAEAGFMMGSDIAKETAQLNMASSAAKSSLQSEALQSLNPAAQRAALGITEGTNPRIEAALRSQASAAERQAVQEVEAQLTPQSADQLGETLKNAIQEGDTITAQAAQNKLGNIGNKGVSVMASAIDSAEKSSDKQEWDEMRLTLARNMGGNVMDKNEALKRWATGTTYKDGQLKNEYKKDDNGNYVKDANGNRIQTNNLALSNLNERVASPGAMADMALEKFAKQTPDMQKAMIGAPGKESAISTSVMQNALNDKNRGAFDTDVLEAMQQKVNASSSGGPTSAVSGSSTSSTGSSGASSAPTPPSDPTRIDLHTTPPQASSTQAPNQDHTASTVSTTNNATSTTLPSHLDGASYTQRPSGLFIPNTTPPSSDVPPHNDGNQQ